MPPEGEILHRPIREPSRAPGAPMRDELVTHVMAISCGDACSPRAVRVGRSSNAGGAPGGRLSCSPAGQAHEPERPARFPICSGLGKRHASQGAGRVGKRLQAGVPRDDSLSEPRFASPVCSQPHVCRERQPGAGAARAAGRAPSRRSRHGHGIVPGVKGVATRSTADTFVSWRYPAAPSGPGRRMRCKESARYDQSFRS